MLLCRENQTDEEGEGVETVRGEPPDTECRIERLAASVHLSKSEVFATCEHLSSVHEALMSHGCPTEARMVEALFEVLEDRIAVS